MSEALQGREASIRGGRLLWSLLTVTFTVLAAAILHDGVARNECTAEAYTRTVTERGIQAVRPLPLSGTESGFSP